MLEVSSNFTYITVIGRRENQLLGVTHDWGKKKESVTGGREGGKKPIRKKRTSPAKDQATRNLTIIRTHQTNGVVDQVLEFR